MARRKSHKRKTHRRRRVGALSLNPSSPLIQFGSVAIGYLMGGTINSLVDGLVPASMKTVDKAAGTGKMIAVAQAGLGAMLVMGKMGKKSTLSVGLGGILAGAGLKRAMVVFKTGASTLSGYGQVPVIGGYQNVPVIGAYTPNNSLNGYQTAPIAINGAGKPNHSKIMGSFMGNGKGSGSGVSNPGSDLMG